MTVLERIAAEREKQIAKGWTAAHDDTHVDGEIAEAAEQIIHHTGPVQYMPHRIGKDVYADARSPSQWHLHIIAKWKHDKVKMLTIAAALLVAEIERIERLEVQKLGDAIEATGILRREYR